MNSNLISAYIQTASLIYVLIVLIVFFVKSKIKSLENKEFGLILIENAIGLVLVLVCFYFSTYTKNMFMIEYCYKLIFLLIVVWVLTFTMYISVISEKLIYKVDEKYKRYLQIRRALLILCVISALAIAFLPTNIIIDNVGVYADPSSMSFYAVYGVILLCSLLWWKYLFTGKIKNEKKYYPIYGFIILGIASALVQYKYPYLALTVPVESFITILIYFTMENPDIRLVELEKTEKDRALKLSESKTAFLANMSKELRTPLATIVGTSEDLTSFNTNNYQPEINEDIRDINNAANTLLEIIGNIMDISKIESGTIDIIPSDYNPKEEFEALAKMMRPKVAEKPIEFKTQISENIPEILYGDRVRIKQIINNFLSNAIKYTEKGNVDFIVEWYDASRSLFIQVKDTGRGVKLEDIDRLFAKYDRVDVEKVSNVQGTGLGLSITKELIEKMGGTVEVESEYGRGTTFKVVIPQQLGNKQKYEQEHNKIVEEKNYNFGGKRILVIDDNQLNIKTFKKTVKTFNLIIDECYTGKEAIEKTKINYYDIIFTDIGMPEMSGEEVLTTLKSSPDFKTPIVAVTAEATSGAREKYLGIGFDDYILKPVTKKAIGNCIYELLYNKKEMKEDGENNGTI